MQQVVDNVVDMNVAVVGGCGHVGLPLALALADSGLKVVSYDISQSAVDTVNGGQMPFMEDGAGEVLARVLSSGDFRATTDPRSVSRAEYVVVVVGTPVDEHLNPKPEAVVQAVKDLSPYLRSEQLLVLRSTVFPGVTAAVEKALAGAGLEVHVAFCPERIAEGFAMKELFELPQIVGVRDDDVFASASRLFGALGVKVHRTTPEEAELAKLITNTWRYIKFAAANQFWMMANDSGLDYAKIVAATEQDYPRAADMPGAGFAAGPCLLKDTMQLAAFTNNTFLSGTQCHAGQRGACRCTSWNASSNSSTSTRWWSECWGWRSRADPTTPVIPCPTNSSGSCGSGRPK